MISIFSAYSGSQALIAFAGALVAILFALSMHELAHALVAYKQGDITAKSLGRLTLNPFAHLDPIGTLMIVLFGFGWARPVPINPLKFKNYKKGLFLVSIAGVVTNFVLAFIGTGAYVALTKYAAIEFLETNALGFALNIFLVYFIFINVVLGIFNLLPIPPLDGFKVLTCFVSFSSRVVQFINRNGFWILVILILSGALNTIIIGGTNYVIDSFADFWGMVFNHTVNII